MDIFNIIQELRNHFEHPLRSSRPTGTAKGPRWRYSPYFIFMEIPVYKVVLKSPNGSLEENITINPLRAWNSTQNIAICRLLEREAKNKKAEQEISLITGEGAEVAGIFQKTQDLLQKEYPHFYLPEEERSKLLSSEKIEKTKNAISETKETVEKVRNYIAKFANAFGIKMMFAYPGPYEKMIAQRMTKMMQRAPGGALKQVDSWLKSKSGVPGY